MTSKKYGNTGRTSFARLTGRNVPKRRRIGEVRVDTYQCKGASGALADLLCGLFGQKRGNNDYR